MKNSKTIIVLDEDVKQLSLFRHILPRVLAGILLFGLTIYGAFSLPDIKLVQSFLQSVDDYFTGLRQAYAILTIGLILVARHYYKKWKRAE